MREIKYRAYIKKDYNKELVGKMLDVSSIHLKRKKIIIGYSLSNTHYGNRSYLYDDIELMQYTGLHDKNGKEIYEGDIVKINAHSYDFGFEKDRIGEIRFIEGCFGFYKQLSEKEYFFNELSTESGYGELEYYEVIGNIYENSELLKGADNIE